MRKTALDTIYQIAKSHKNIVFIGSDLGVNVMNDFKNDFKDRFFMEGISEQAIIGLASGMALEGYVPFVNTIGTFFVRRALEQIIIDVALHDLKVRFIGNGGGGVYAPLGPTHISFEDLSILRTIPNMTIVVPADANEMKMLIIDSNRINGPIYFRVAKGGDPVITNKINNNKIKIGKALELTEQKKNMIFSTGILTNTAIEISKELKDFGVTHFNTIKPLDKNYISKIIDKVEKIFVIEENLISGGFGSSILEYISIAHKKHLIKISIYGIDDKFPDRYGNQKVLLDRWGLSYKKLKKKIMLNV